MGVLLTAKFKIHNPSRRKREVMDTALEEYTHAYAYLLNWCRDNLATIEAEGKFRARPHRRPGRDHRLVPRGPSGAVGELRHLRRKLAVASTARKRVSD